MRTLHGTCQHANLLHRYNAESHALRIKTVCGEDCTWYARVPDARWDRPKSAERQCAACRREKP